MGSLSIIDDPVTGRWYRNPGATTPFTFDIVVQWEPDSDDLQQETLQYTVRGIDIRICINKAGALQIAKQRLKVLLVNDGLTDEQRTASNQYQLALQYLNHAIMLVENGIMAEGSSDTATTINLSTRRTICRQKLIACAQLGIYFAGQLP